MFLRPPLSLSRKTPPRASGRPSVQLCVSGSEVKWRPLLRASLLRASLLILGPVAPRCFSQSETSFTFLELCPLDLAATG